jgi:predicted NBD/HSP70 family sugar kinase
MDAVLAIDLGGSKFLVGAVTPEGQLLYRERFVWRGTRPGEILSQILPAARAVLGRFPACRAVGVTIPGLADPEAGMWVSSSFLGIRDFPIAAALERELGLPVRIENDCNACALAEWMFDGRAGDADLFYMTVSNSIGGALLSGGQVRSGAFGRAGEIGLLPVERLPDGGVRLPLEEAASGRGLAAAYARLCGRNGEAVPATELARRAAGGDSAAREVFRWEGIYLGEALAVVCNLLDPAQVVLGGGVALSYEQFSASLLQTLQKASGRPAAALPLVGPTCLGYEGALLGAAATALAGSSRQKF